MFEGVQRAQLKCMACNHVSGPPKEPFRTLLVQVKGHPNMAHTLAKDVFWSETRSQLDCDECNKKQVSTAGRVWARVRPNNTKHRLNALRTIAQDKQFVLVCHKLPPLLWVSMVSDTHIDTDTTAGADTDSLKLCEVSNNRGLSHSPYLDTNLSPPPPPLLPPLSPPVAV